MNVASIAGALVVVGVVAQVLVPGRDVYHQGWFNVLLAALAVWAIRGARRAPIVAFGVGIVALAGIASGLLGPDARTIVGAPGTSTRVAEAGGTLVFPLARDTAPVMLERGGSAQPIATQRYTTNVLLRSVMRTVVSVDARDERGAHLTLTQPTGSAFLSPVLLMENRQTINGLSLPYDTFALPAAHRIVTAMLFSTAQAMMTPVLAAMHEPVVLFDVEDETGASIAHGIGVAASGTSVSLAGVELRPEVLSYPAIDVISIPNLVAVAIGMAAIFIGLVLTRKRVPG